MGGKDEGEKYTGTPEQAAEGQGGVEDLPSGSDAEGVDRSAAGTPDAPTPEIEMEEGQGSVQGQHGETTPPGEGATTQQRKDAQDAKGESSS